MHAPDLEPVQHLVNSARRRYVEALTLYEPEGRRDAERVVNDFLVKWQDEPGRSSIGVAESNEAIDLIRKFQAVEATVTTNIALINLQMEQAILHFGVEMLDASMRGIALPCRDEFKEQYQRVWDDVSGQAASIGNHFAFVARRAALLLLIRQATLHSFVGRELNASWRRLVDVLTHEILSVGPEMATEKVVEVHIEHALVVLGVVTGALPIAILLTATYKIVSEAKRDLEIDFSLNATDKMQSLLEELRAEEDLFNEMEQLFSYTLDRFADLSKFKYPKLPC